MKLPFRLLPPFSLLSHTKEDEAGAAAALPPLLAEL